MASDSLQRPQHRVLTARIRPMALWLVCGLVGACAGSIKDESGATKQLSAKQYAEVKDTKALVLVAVNWARRWNCGGFENAELRSLSFDRLPAASLDQDRAADLTIEGPPRLATKPAFLNYAFTVEPGEYALSAFSIKVARSVSDVGVWQARRPELLKDGQPRAGSFKAGAGETVYIGNFWLDCAERPMPWRFYTDKPSWPGHLKEYQQEFPFLASGTVIYRLFETSTMGNPYTLQ